MNWTPEFNAESSYQNNGKFPDSNFQFQGSVNFPLIPTEEASLKQQKKLDQDFINRFIGEKLASKKIIPKSNSLKISSAKSFLLQIINDKKNIEKDVISLDVNDENFNSKWEILASELNKINNKILKFNTDVKIPLTTALKKRLKKRKAIKERKEKFREYKKRQEQKIQEKHKIIDALLNKRSEEVEKVKYEAALKRQADSVLHEVRKKKSEAKKMLNLLVALAKLRELRSKEEEKLGGYCSKQLTETFNKVITRFQNLWEKQLEVYKLEEKGLKIMLEENIVPHKKDSKFETNILQWEKVLFGDIINDENEKLLTKPETDIQALIQVRRDWDRFLTAESTPMASSIPLGWVLPPETKDEKWRAFIKTSKNISL